jgi:D-amino-acid oxidase
MNRRRFLCDATFATASIAATSGLAGCLRRAAKGTGVAGASLPLNMPPNLPDDACDLLPVRVSSHRVIRSVVGLRPYRPSGFRVERERLGDTIVVHNYGHGGAGITLCWGTSKLALDLGVPGYSGPVAVLGSGVAGLTTARLLQDAGFGVTIYAKALPPNTTSNIAGGQWSPATVYGDPDSLSQTFTEQYIFACRFAYERYQILTPARYGVRWMRNYVLSRTPQEPPQPPPPSSTGKLTVRSATHPFRPEMKVIPQGQHAFGDLYCAQFDGMLIEPPLFLDALITDFRIAGGKFVVGEIHTPAEIQALSQKLVFNCTGLGAKALFNDAELTPVRGQLTFLVPQPEVTYATIFEDTYMFSRHDGVLLGGTHDEGNWSLEVDPGTVMQKLAAQAELFSHMRPCSVRPSTNS